MSNFIHLHTHSYGSTKDGCQSPKQIVERAAKLNMNAVALTDHGNCSEILSFKKECEKNNVKYIPGCELYLAPSSRFIKERIEGHTKVFYHITVLAKNYIGLQNLFTLCSKGWTEGFYYKPRVDIELLKELSDGLIVLSGCGSGRAAVKLMECEEENAYSYLKTCREIWKDDFYVEVQNHNIDWQKDLYYSLFTAGKDLNIPLVVTQDSHYTSREDAELHNYICKLAAGDLSFDSDQSWFKSYDEIMEMAFDSHWQEAVERTQEVANKCNCEWDYSKTIWPVFPLENKTPEEQLREDAYKGLYKLFHTPEQKYIDRLESELETIGKMGFPNYFLIVADFVNWAKNNSVFVGPGRGSSASSLVCYCLNITEIDPIKYDLLFSRFISEHRVSLPDIDIDIDPERRDKVYEYIESKYGANKCSHIGTTASFKPRGALRDFARVCGYDRKVQDKLASMVPPDIAGKALTFDEVIAARPEILKTEYNDVVTLARKSEGIKKQFGVHAAGVVVSDREIYKDLPLFLGKDDVTATQFNMHDVEEIGLVKFDLLGLKNLTVIGNTLKLIKQNKNIEVNISSIEDGDPKVYSEIFGKGNLDGVFQFETSSGFKDLCVQVKPQSIEDLAVISSLFRPGPLGSGMLSEYIERRGGKKFEYIVPQAENALKSSFGILILQEQIMRICVDVAGYSLADSDTMRRIVGKKKHKEMKAEKEKFISGCIKNNVSKDKANQLFNYIEQFASYGFCAAHAIAYSTVSYQTAWLKYYYPHEFYCALLNNAITKDQSDLVKYINAAKEEGIIILPPDVNKSQEKFTLDNGTILFGLSGIKGIGEKACEHLIKVRPIDGFSSLDELVKLKVKKDVIGALAECGALEEITTLNRTQILEHLPDLMKYYDKLARWKISVEKFEQNKTERLKAIEAGEKPPRRRPKPKEEPKLPEIEPGEEIPSRDRLTMERKTIGFYISGHPLDSYPGLVNNAQYNVLDIKDDDIKDGDVVSLPVVVSLIKEKRTKKQQDMAVVIVEDKTGRVEITIFPKQWKAIKPILEEDSVIVLKARIKKIIQDDGPPITNIIAINITVINSDVGYKTETLNVYLKDNTHVEFIPTDDSVPSRWQQATAYIKNLKRMGY